jgi:hypothetical protein
MAGRLPGAGAPWRCHGRWDPHEDALVYIENAILMILAEMAASGVSAPPDEPAPGSVLLTIPDG